MANSSITWKTKIHTDTRTHAEPLHFGPVLLHLLSLQWEEPWTEGHLPFSHPRTFLSVLPALLCQPELACHLLTYPASPKAFMTSLSVLFFWAFIGLLKDLMDCLSELGVIGTANKTRPYSYSHGAWCVAGNAARNTHTMSSKCSMSVSS